MLACRSSTTPRISELTAGAEAHEGYVASVARPGRLADGRRSQCRGARPGGPGRRYRRRPAVAAAPDARLNRRRPGPGPPRPRRRPARHLRRHSPPPRLHRRVDRRGPPLGLGGPRCRREATGPWADGVLDRRALRHLPAGQPAAPDRRRCRRLPGGALDGTADAVVTDHAPHTVVDKEVEFGKAANGISGIETALGILLSLVDARQAAARPGRGRADHRARSRRRRVRSQRRDSAPPGPRGLIEGAPRRPGRLRSRRPLARRDRSPPVARQELAAARSRAAGPRSADDRLRPLAYEDPDAGSE